MKDGVFRAAQRVDAADDQLFAALAEDLNRNIVRNAAFLDQAPAKIEFDLRRAGEPYFDLLETDAHEHLEILQLFLHAHRLGESLIAVAEVDTAPDGGAVERAVGPLAVGQVNGGKRAIFRNRCGLHGSKKVERQNGNEGTFASQLPGCPGQTTITPRQRC